MEQKIDLLNFSGPSPLELFLSSLGGCVGVYAKKYLDRHQIPYKQLQVQASGELSQESPIGLINLNVRVFTDAQLGKNKEVFLKFINNCPIHNTLLHTKSVAIELV